MQPCPNDKAAGQALIRYFTKSPCQDCPTMSLVIPPEHRQTWLWIAVGLLFVALLVLLGPVLTPFVAAAIMGYVLNPAVDKMASAGLPRALAVLIAIVGVGLIIAALALIVVPILADELPVLRTRLPSLLAKIDAAIGPWLRQMGLAGRLDLPALQKALAAKLAAGDGAGSAVLTWLRVGGSALIGWVATLFLVPIVLFYLLVDWHPLFRRIGDSIPRRWIARATDMAGNVVEQMITQPQRSEAGRLGQLRHT